MHRGSIATKLERRNEMKSAKGRFHESAKKHMCDKTDESLVKNAIANKQLGVDVIKRKIRTKSNQLVRLLNKKQPNQLQVEFLICSNELDINKVTVFDLI